MKKALLIPMMAFLLISCPAESYDIHNLFSPSKKSPVLLDFKLYSNRLISIGFDEQVILLEVLLDNNRLVHDKTFSRLQNIDLQMKLDAGIEKRLSFTVENHQGNTARFSIPVVGVNINQAKALITELSTKGTADSPDRIELHITKDGTTAGLCLSDAVIGMEDHRFHLPELKVKKNDIIVISWDREIPGGERTEKNGMYNTFFINAGSEKTLSGSNGVVILFSHINGDGAIMDALPYNSSSASLSDGYGNEKSRVSAERLISDGLWEGDTVISDEVTTSRVIARYWPYQDTNTKDDFYITAARNSTFGERNTNVVYVP